MNRRQRRATEKAQGKPDVRLAISAPDRQSAEMAAQLMKFVEDRWPSKSAEAIDNVAYTLMSLSASYVALLPAGPHRDAVVSEAPKVFRQLVLRAVARGIEADRFEESIGGITAKKLREAGGQEL